MALASTLYRFRIALSDIDHGIYENLDLRTALHPSETATYLLTRVLGFALCFEEGLEFSKQGLADPDGPTILSLDAGGAIQTWVEIGNPNAKKAHRAAKNARRLRIVTYKDPTLLVKELRDERVHRAEEWVIFALPPRALAPIEELLKRDNEWTVLYQEGLLTLGIDGESYEVPVEMLQVS